MSLLAAGTRADQPYHHHHHLVEGQQVSHPAYDDNYPAHTLANTSAIQRGSARIFDDAIVYQFDAAFTIEARI